MTDAIQSPSGRCGARPAGRWRVSGWLAALLLLAAACSPHTEIYPQLEQLARGGKYGEAVQVVEKSKDVYGDRNAVLYNLDRGILLHYAGEYEQSNVAFEAAERRMDELYTESITGNIAAFALNDNTLPYRGEDFETVAVNLYRALNYVQLGQPDSALVEARKVNLKLEAINQQYDDGAKNVYQEDAFARLLAALLYELGGTRDDVNDAYISARLAADAYAKDFNKHYGIRTPETLAQSLLTTALFMGPEELAQAKARFPNEQPTPLARKRDLAQLTFIHFAGRGPTKVEDAIRALMPDGVYLKIAFPRYKPNFYLIDGSRVQVDGKPGVKLDVGQPIGAIAVENLNNRKGRISVKAIARATTKYIANKALQDRARKESAGAGLLAFVAGTAFNELSEQADLRSWQTLPDKVLIGQQLVEPGEREVRVQFTSASGAVVSTRELGKLTLRPGESRFVILHTLQ